MSKNEQYIREPGTYSVVVASALPTKSKAGNPMLAVEFKDIADGRLIKSWFVAGNEYALKRLDLFKLAAGLTSTAKAPDMVGTKLKIQVQLQKDNPKYSEVCNFMPLSAPTPPTAPESDEPLPF